MFEPNRFLNTQLKRLFKGRNISLSVTRDKVLVHYKW